MEKLKLDRNKLTLDLVKILGKNVQVFTNPKENKLSQKFCISIRDGIPEPEDITGLAKILWKENDNLDILILTEDEIFADNTDYLIRQTFDSEHCKKIKINLPDEIDDRVFYDIIILPKKLENPNFLLNEEKEQILFLLEPNIEFGFQMNHEKKVNFLVDRKDIFKLIRIFNDYLQNGLINTRDFNDIIQAIREGNICKKRIEKIRQVIIDSAENKNEFFELIEKVKTNLDSEFLINNPEALDILSFCVSLSPDENNREGCQDGISLYKRIKRQRKNKKTNNRTFELYKENFFSLIDKIAETKEGKREVSEIARILLNTSEIDKLIKISKTDFNKEITRRLIDIVMEKPQKYRLFSKFDELYKKFIEIAYENKALLKEER